MGHWQILGGQRVVNFWPEAKRGPRLYVAGESRGRFGSLAKAISAAGKPVAVETPAEEAGQHYEYVEWLDEIPTQEHEHVHGNR